MMISRLPWRPSSPRSAPLAAGLLVTLLAATTPLGACGEGQPGSQAPFVAPTAPPPPPAAPEAPETPTHAQPHGADTSPPPRPDTSSARPPQPHTPTAPPKDTHEAPSGDRAAPRAAALLQHIHGPATSWPCSGHPSCEQPSPANGFVGVDVTSAEFIDPNMVSDTEGTLVALNLFEGLIVRSRRSGIPLQPGVAERWDTSEDGRVYTFHLRADARWSDGHPVTAQDFVYSWRRKLAPQTGSTSVEPLYWISGARAYNEGKTDDPSTVGVRATDARTLVVTLDNPTPFWLDYVAAAYYLPVPRAAIEAYGKRWTRPEHIITNGAFHLTEWEPRSRLVLTRSATYWDAAHVRLPGVILHVSESQTQSLTRYNTGTLQWARAALTGADLPGLIRSDRPDFFIDPYLCFYAYLFNTKRPPFDDVRVRRAVNMAIDKRRLVTLVVGGLQVPADGPVMPHFAKTMGYPKPHGDGYDPDHARRLLAEAGYPNGEGFPALTILYNTSESHKAIAEFVQRGLSEQLGVKASAVNVEWKSLLKQLRTGDFQMARFGMCGIEHPYDMMNLFLSYHPENSMGYASAEFDGLMEQARRTLDRPRQMALLAKAEAVLQRDTPMAPIYYYTKAYLKKPVLQGIEPELTNTHLFKYMYWADRPAATR